METPVLPITELDQFVVFGLGSLGQHCVIALKEFDVKVIAIAHSRPSEWEIPNLEDLLDQLLIGDYLQDRILKQAQIDQCRAALLVTNNERINTEIALAIRQLNPYTRLVVSSGKENLNRLLSEQLGNFIAFESTQLPVQAFAIAALGTDILGIFNIDHQWLRVVKEKINLTHPWCNNYRISEINHRTRQVINYYSSSNPSFQEFYQWKPEQLIKENDTIFYLEIADYFFSHQRQIMNKKSSKKEVNKIFNYKIYWDKLQHKIQYFLQLTWLQQLRKIAIISSIIVIFLLIIGTLLFYDYYPQTTLISAFYATIILLLGGYGDLFGDFQQIPFIPWWLQLFALLLTLIGTAFIGVLYALLIERLLYSKLEFIKSRPPFPEQDHVVLIGLEKVGQKIAKFLQELNQPLIGVSLNNNYDNLSSSEIPLIQGESTEINKILTNINMQKAKSIIISTDDEILNLEIALMIKKINDQIPLVIRSTGQRLTQNSTHFLPESQVLSVHSIMAEAFAGAAFGENIISLFRLNNQTILVTEYQIEKDDTLNDFLLVEIAYGYSVIPILYQHPHSSAIFMPSHDLRLSIGDRLIVLATIEGLKRVEIGEISPKNWYLKVEKAKNSEAIFEGANIIARISGTSLNDARNLMNNLPNTLKIPLYENQGKKLVQLLHKVQVTANLSFKN